MKRAIWNTSSTLKKKQKVVDNENDDDESAGGIPLVLPSFGGASSRRSMVKSHLNHVYFNDDITSETVFDLIHTLRDVEHQQKIIAATFGSQPNPIYLHLTTNGGEIHAAFSVVDTIEQLSVPVYTVVDGFVASAGTLISLAGKKRFISKNAYMLLHELRSGVWGKMSSIEEEMENLKKIMEHLTEYYMTKTSMTRKALDKLLVKDVIWSARECISKGVVDEIM
jgi:ATP-dependent protease ClpP protease subunit